MIEIEDLKVSNRTLQKILIRSGRNKCSLCGWDKSSVDVHHILEKCEGGTNTLTNLICLCPNCHRCVHDKNLNFITKEELISKSLYFLLRNWRDFYKIKNTRQTPKPPRSYPKCYTKDCNHLTYTRSKYCSPDCRKNNTKQPAISSRQELEALLDRHNWNFTRAGKEVGISDNGIRGYCRRLGLQRDSLV